MGTGWLANNHPGFPGYSGALPLDAATLAETLRAQGYSTIMVGKWHNTPNSLTLLSSPKDSWPSQRGFDYFYGFLGGETNFFFPARLMLSNALLPIDTYPDDYYTTDDWTDKAIDYVREVHTAAPEQPFFLYIAHNAVHVPLQAKLADLRKYHGRYDAGWIVLREARYQRQLELGIIPPSTKLAASDPMIPDWDRATPADRRLYARHMEVYAAMLDCVDQNFGRSESVDRRDQYPEKLHELVEAFDQAAWLNMVYPLDNRAMLQKLSDRAPEGQPLGPRTFKPGGQTIHNGLIVPLIANRHF